MRRVEPFTPHFFVKVIVKLYFISDVGRQAAAAEGDKLEDEFKERVASFRGGFEEA